MSLVGTRPILQDELQKYELHHRATNSLFSFHLFEYSCAVTGQQGHGHRIIHN